MKDIIVGLLAIVGVILGVLVLAALIAVITYGIGYSIGWFVHLMVGPDMVFGLPFEQFFGILFITGSVIGGSRSLVDKTKENENIKKLADQMKNYRGY